MVRVSTRVSAVFQADGARADEYLICPDFGEGLFCDMAYERQFAVAQHSAQANDRDPAFAGKRVDHRQ